MKKLAKKTKNVLPKTSSSPPVTYSEIYKSLVLGYGKQPSQEARKDFTTKLSKYLMQELLKKNSFNNYNILVLFDNTILTKGDSDNIYRAINDFEDKTKPILLVLVSGGGEPGSAYLIGKLCQEFCNNKFVVVIPRHAKSAATLLSCGANEIHMGSLSELGPIDPQFNGMPALGLKNSIEHIAELVSKTPGSAEMFSRYLQRTVEPIQIGYYERVAESAIQYAEKLLTKHKDLFTSSPNEIATRLVYGYKDHGFVIDKEEARTIFGDKMIKSNTPEYDIGNSIYTILSKISDTADNLNYYFCFIGSINSEPTLFPKAKK